MLPRGAKHPGGIAVPAIRVGAGGHRPRRTSQLVLIRSSEHARGTALFARWRGHAAMRRISSDEERASLPKPLPPPFGRSPFPAARGRMK
jgi:hypothetical protein